MNHAKKVAASKPKANPQATIENMPKKKLGKSIKYKMAGTAIILFSWIVQNYSFDSWDSKSKDYMESARDFSDMTRSSLLYENLYYVVNGSDDSMMKSALKREYIHQAAMKYVGGLTVSTVNRPLDTEDKQRLIDSLKGLASNVYDFDAFNNYILEADRLIGDTRKEAEEQVKEIKFWRTLFKNVYLLLYLVGTGVLIWGMKHE
ncbi:hypothetical protein CJD36_022475 [Flavipsychrobacter stenotrophus]|uniref:Chemotaxis methyl-accepting receptor HlyB-like 4HB MCP domain-containing protein n=1 Tax=Flavipsychrobacter stenotrophus TaxID=2077091 RepID=A0A2S7SPX4_9BACT|nr:hypothetical protein [Flavipsychrobacter stenotrophus]PQJ08768.1 hypothetical protein CJD36_022475 [Flavipsychrobacter stenotrophus]